MSKKRELLTDGALEKYLVKRANEIIQDARREVVSECGMVTAENLAKQLAFDAAVNELAADVCLEKAEDAIGIPGDGAGEVEVAGGAVKGERYAGMVLRVRRW